MHANYIPPGKSSFSEKGSFTEMLADVDNYTTMTFPVLAKSDLTTYIGGSFVPFVEHPGSIFIVRKISVAEQVIGIAKNIFRVWPLIVLLVLVVLFVGIIVWFVVSVCLDANC